MTTRLLLTGLAILLASVSVLVPIVFWIRQRRKTKEVRVEQTQLLDLQNSWQCPPALRSMRTPRPVMFTRYGRGAIVFGVLFFAMLVFFVWSIGSKLNRNYLLSAEGVVAQATISKKWVTRGRRGSTTSHATYVYQVGGRQYEGTTVVTSEAYQRLNVGAELGIQYAASRPGISRPDGANDQILIQACLVVLFIVLLTVAPSVMARERSLLTRGEPTGAIVTRVSPTQNGHAVRYQFLDRLGQTVSGGVEVWRFSGQAPEAGQIVTIFYDPERPKRNTMSPGRWVRFRDKGISF